MLLTRFGTRGPAEPEPVYVPPVPPPVPGDVVDLSPAPPATPDLPMER
jgi:hypothetical protein